MLPTDVPLKCADARRSEVPVHEGDVEDREEAVHKDGEVRDPIGVSLEQAGPRVCRTARRSVVPDLAVCPDECRAARRS